MFLAPYRHGESPAKHYSKPVAKTQAVNRGLIMSYSEALWSFSCNCLTAPLQSVITDKDLEEVTCETSGIVGGASMVSTFDPQ